LKPTEQYIQAAKKAQTVSVMINRQFKMIDKEDFGIIYKTYVRPHLEYCIQAWSPHLQKDRICLEKVQKVSKTFYMKPDEKARYLLPRRHTTVRQNFFSLRVINEWNKLPQEVVEAPSTNTFKNRLDKYWNDMGVFS